VSEWKEFEKAVANFICALSPGAKVSHDIILPDRDSGKPRQRDVWIETTVCKIFPVKVFVSCKRWKRKVNQQNLDAFLGEFQSSGAHLGVIYSYSGFTSPALKKAKVHDICCCKLYQNEPPDIPNLIFLSFYCCASSAKMKVNNEAINNWGEETLSEIFQLPSKGHATLLDALSSEFIKAEKEAVKNAIKEEDLNRVWHATCKIENDKDVEVEPLFLTIEGRWRVYRARLEAHLVDGSYSFIGESFFGTITSPCINLQGPNPGPGWELLTNLPELSQPNFGVIFLMGGDIAEPFQEEMGNKKLKNLIKLS